MNKSRWFTKLFLAVALFSAHSHSISCEEAVYNAGTGYEDCRRTPSLTPAIALGAVVLIAIIAVAVQNSKDSSSNCSSSSK